MHQNWLPSRGTVALAHYQGLELSTTCTTWDNLVTPGSPVASQCSSSFSTQRLEILNRLPASLAVKRRSRLTRQASGLAFSIWLDLYARCLFSLLPCIFTRSSPQLKLTRAAISTAKQCLVPRPRRSSPSHPMPCQMLHFQSRGTLRRSREAPLTAPEASFQVGAYSSAWQPTSTCVPSTLAAKAVPRMEAADCASHPPASANHASHRDHAVK